VKKVCAQCSPRPHNADTASGHITSIACHTFLEETVSFNAQRIDSWISTSGKWARGAFNVDTLASAALPKPRCVLSAARCVFKCSEEETISQAQAARKLLWHISAADEVLLSATESDKQRRRMEVVELADAVVRASPATLEFLAAEASLVDHEKLLRSWQLLARPIANIRTIARIAKLLPSFRSAKFVAIKPPTLVQLDKDHIISVQEAMERLDISIDRDCGLPQALRRKKSQFRKDCAQGFPSHCETQLLMRYENEPSLTPTLPYFGCSKKACFLCDSFLFISPLQPRMRGRHGRCHPRWGIQPRTWEALRPRLIELRDVIKAHVLKILRADTKPDRVMIQQSSIRSEIKSKDVHDLSRQAANLHIAEENAKMLRENMQILQGPRMLSCRCCTS
jgi:TfoX/Sxy family transcriptional regulator of competence genes